MHKPPSLIGRGNRLNSTILGKIQYGLALVHKPVGGGAWTPQGPEERSPTTTPASMDQEAFIMWSFLCQLLPDGLQLVAGPACGGLLFLVRRLELLVLRLRSLDCRYFIDTPYGHR
jgi:hypothetical protein